MDCLCCSLHSDCSWREYQLSSLFRCAFLRFFFEDCRPSQSSLLIDRHHLQLMEDVCCLAWLALQPAMTPVPPVPMLTWLHDYEDTFELDWSIVISSVAVYCFFVCLLRNLCRFTYSLQRVLRPGSCSCRQLVNILADLASNLHLLQTNRLLILSFAYSLIHGSDVTATAVRRKYGVWSASRTIIRAGIIDRRYHLLFVSSTFDNCTATCAAACIGIGTWLGISCW